MANIQATLDNVLAKLDSTIDKLLTLEIKTVVVGMTVTPAGNAGEWTLAPQAGAVAEGMHTTIRLEQGDVTNVMSPGAMANAELADFHAAQVAMSREIIAGNLKTIADLVTSLRG